MKSAIKAAAGLAALAAVSACSSSGGGLDGLVPDPTGPGGGGALPVTAKGKMLGVRLPATISTEISTWNKLPMHNATATGAVATDRTAPAGVGVTGSADADPSPNQNQANGTSKAALISAKADGGMAGGAKFIGLDKAKGAVYFEGGNFGDPQAESASAAISTVSVYNTFRDGTLVEKTILKDVTTVRYRDGNAGDTAANYGVGYVGNPTASMPGAGTATYKGFYEQGIGVYAKGDGSVGQMYMSGDAELKADFAAGKVTGGLKNGKLETYDDISNSTKNLNTAIKGIAIDATISGSEYAGTAALVDGAGAKVGTVSHGNAIGGFFGADAAETAAAVSVEGNAVLDGKASDYVLQGVFGGVKK